MLRQHTAVAAGAGRKVRGCLPGCAGLFPRFVPDAEHEFEGMLGERGGLLCRVSLGKAAPYDDLHRLAYFDDMAVGIVETYGALLPAVFVGRVEQFDGVGPLPEPLHECVEVVRFEIELHVVRAAAHGIFREARKPREFLLYGEAAAERDVLPEIQYDPLVEQPAVEPFRAADIADGDQRHLIFDIHYLFWFLTGVSLAARAITW